MDKWWLLAPLGLVLAWLNFDSVLRSVATIVQWEYMYDWWVFEEAVSRIGTGTMYEWGEPSGYFEDTYRHRYAPLFAYAIAPFTWMGLGAWRVLHFVALAFLPWRVALLVGLSAPFWFDVATAGQITFALVLGWHAVKGNRWAFAGFLVMALLVPRPLMLPVVAWCLWKQPAWRLPSLGATAGYAVLTLATGQTGPFLASLASSSDAFAYPSNFGPTRWLGWFGIPVSLALGIWLTWKGRLGLASLAISPYIVPYYWLMLGLELRKPLDHRRVAGVTLRRRGAEAGDPLIRGKGHARRGDLVTHFVHRFGRPR